MFPVAGSGIGVHQAVHQQRRRPRRPFGQRGL